MTMPSIDEAAIEHLARAAGIEIKPERWAMVADRLNELFALAAEIETIPYRHLPPAMLFEPSWNVEEREEELP